MMLFRKFIFNEARSRFLTRKLRWTVKAKRKFFQTEINPNLKEIKDLKASEKEFVKFEDMLLKRRNQAERSIIVQVHSEQSCPELYSFCLKYAPVVNMFHYSHNKNHFVLVEFSEKVTEAVMPKCSHSTKPLNGEVKVPVASPVLWFKAAGLKEKKLVTPSVSQIPLQNTLSPFEWSSLLELISSASSISEGMKILYEATKLDELGVRLRFLTARQLELSLNGLFPNCAAIPFGSSLNSFGKLGCDLDLVFQHNYILPFLKTDEASESRLVYQCKINSGGIRVHTQRQMEVLADIIHVYIPGCTGIKRILQARVPIVKYTNEITGLDCDVSMSNLTGVYMSEVLYLLASIEPLSRELVFTVKRWAKDVGLTNATPGRWITNFTLTLLCLFYMQVKSILPPLNHLRSQSLKEDTRTTEDIDCTFCRDLSRLEWEKGDKMDAGQLLKGFFDYYTKFDFSSLGVSLNSGGPFVKPDYSPMYVANPLEKGLNVAKNMSAEEVERLRIAMRNASWDLENNESLLSLISKDNQFKREKKYIPNRMVAVKDLFTER